MEKEVFMAILTKCMRYDDIGDKDMDVIRDYANKKSIELGYENWVDAYHKYGQKVDDDVIRVGDKVEAHGLCLGLIKGEVHEVVSVSNIGRIGLKGCRSLTFTEYNLRKI